MVGRRSFVLLTLLVLTLAGLAFGVWLIRRPVHWDGRREAVFRIALAYGSDASILLEAVEIAGQRKALRSDGSVEPVILAAGSSLWRARYSLPGQTLMLVRIRLRFGDEGGAMEAVQWVAPPLTDLCSLWINVQPSGIRIPDCVLDFEDGYSRSTPGVDTPFQLGFRLPGLVHRARPEYMTAARRCGVLPVLAAIPPTHIRHGSGDGRGAV